MSFLHLLLDPDPEDFTDSQLVKAVENVEYENFLSGITDSQLVQDVSTVEEMMNLWIHGLFVM